MIKEIFDSLLNVLMSCNFFDIVYVEVGGNFIKFKIEDLFCIMNLGIDVFVVFIK